MMKLTLAEPKFLKESVNIISDLVNDINIKVNSDGLQVIAMDPANVALIDFRLLSSAFSEYEVDSPLELSISLEGLKSIMKRAKPSDSILLAYEKGDNRLKVDLVGGSKRSFSIPLINLDATEQRIPTLKFSTRVDMPSEQFDEAVEDVSIIAESVALKIKDGRFYINSENNLSEASVELPSTESISVKTDGEDVMARYSMDYLKKMIKGSKMADSVSIEFNKDYPVRVSYTVTDKVYLSFILAPRVSND